MRRLFLAAVVIATAAGAAMVMATGSSIVTSGDTAKTATATAVTLYKNPLCSCCEGYAQYLRQNGYAVTVKATHDLALIRRQLGIPEKLAGCHTSLVDNYVVEGHVPLATLNRLLAERPGDIKGIALPGMPPGSPGMTGQKTEPFTIYAIPKDAGGAAPKIYAVE